MCQLQTNCHTFKILASMSHLKSSPFRWHTLMHPLGLSLRQVMVMVFCFPVLYQSLVLPGSATANEISFEKFTDQLIKNKIGSTLLRYLFQKNNNYCQYFWSHILSDPGDTEWVVSILERCRETQRSCRLHGGFNEGPQTPGKLFIWNMDWGLSESDEN